jgi:hypothetical protein
MAYQHLLAVLVPVWKIYFQKWSKSNCSKLHPIRSSDRVIVILYTVIGNRNSTIINKQRTTCRVNCIKRQVRTCGFNGTSGNYIVIVSCTCSVEKSRCRNQGRGTFNSTVTNNIVGCIVYKTNGTGTCCS